MATSRTLRAGVCVLWTLALALWRSASSQPPPASNEVLQIDLPTALRLADERNLDVALYIERVAEASARLAQARLLAVPSIEIGAEQTRHEGNLQETGGQVVDVDRASRFTGISTGVGVDLAGAIFQPLAARQNRAATQAAANANRHAVLLDVATTYLALLRAQTDERIARELFERAMDLANLTADYAEAGEGLLADAELAAVQPLLFEQRRLAAEERAAAATAGLAQLLNFDVNVELQPVETAVPLIEIFSPQEDVAQLVERALDNRPETDQYDALVAAAEAALTAERYGLFIPSVGLDYSSGDFGGAPGSSIRNTDRRDDLALQLYWRFHGFGLGNRARLDEKRAQLRQLSLERDKLHDAIVAEVRSEYARVQSLRGQMQFAELAVARARQAYTLNRERIFDQQGLPLEALSAMQALATAELTHLETRTAYTLAQIRLHTALGSPIDSQF